MSAPPTEGYVSGALMGQTDADDDDKADEADEQKEAEEEDALEGDDDADVDEDDPEDAELDEDAPGPDDEEDEDDKKDREEEEEDDDDTDPGVVLMGPVGACCPHRLGVHDKVTTACNACGCDGFVFPEDQVMGTEANNDSSIAAEAEACAVTLSGIRSAGRLEAVLLRAMPGVIERLAGKPIFGLGAGDCEDNGPISPLFAEALRQAKARRDLGDRSPALRALPSVKKRFPLPLPATEIPPYTTVNITVRPQITCMLRRLICEPTPDLVLLDMKVGKNSMMLAYGGGMPLSAFPGFPPELTEAAISAIERAGFWENIPQEVAQVSMDVTVCVQNLGRETRTFRGLVLTDVVDY